MPSILSISTAEALGFWAQLRLRLTEADWLGLLESWSLRALSVVLILVVGFWIARKLSRALAQVLKRSNAEPILVGFLRNIAYFGLLIVVFIAALAQAGVNPASLIAVLGAAGIAIALALRDSLSNFASGVMLILLRPFKAGDFVQVAGLEGVIKQVRVFQTQMHTVDNRLIVLPNSQITAAPIVNFSTLPKRRLDLVIGIGYENNLASARSALLAASDSSSMVLTDPPAQVLVTALTESSVQLTLQAWVATQDVLAARSLLLEAIHREIRSCGLTTPLPQRDLYIYRNGAPPSDVARETPEEGSR